LLADGWFVDGGADGWFVMGGVDGCSLMADSLMGVLMVAR
jgi:hypothetical protein